MKKFVFLLIIPVIFSCKKQDLPSDLRIKSAKYFRNDSLIGQTDYQYRPGTGLLEFETSSLNFGNYYSKHTYNFLNDSIQVDEDMYNGIDTSSRLITVYVTGTKHLVTRITMVSKPFMIKIYDRNYMYNGSDQLTEIDYNSAKQGFDFGFNSGELSTFKILSGSDTSQVDITYIDKSNQPGINYLTQLNDLDIPQVMGHALNLELCGCGFNATGKLLYTSRQGSSAQIIAGSAPVSTYSYAFDNFGRVKTKSYKTESILFPSSTTYRVEYEYM